MRKHRKNCETALVSVRIKENVFFCQVGRLDRYVRKIGQWVRTKTTNNKQQNNNNNNNNNKETKKQNNKTTKKTKQ